MPVILSRGQKVTIKILVKAHAVRGLHYSVIWYIVIKTMARKPQAGPASDPELLILASLAKGPLHGYAILVDVEESFGSSMGPGNLVHRYYTTGGERLDCAGGRQR